MIINTTIRSHWGLAVRTRTRKSLKRAIKVTVQTLWAMWRANYYSGSIENSLNRKRRTEDALYERIKEAKELYRRRERAKELRDRRSA